MTVISQDMGVDLQLDAKLKDEVCPPQGLQPGSGSTKQRGRQSTCGYGVYLRFHTTGWAPGLRPPVSLCDYLILGFAAPPPPTRSPA